MKFIISEQEKQRILEMHQNASSRQYLNEVAKPYDPWINFGAASNNIGLKFKSEADWNSFYSNATLTFNSSEGKNFPNIMKINANNQYELKVYQTRGGTQTAKNVIEAMVSNIFLIAAANGLTKLNQFSVISDIRSKLNTQWPVISKININIGTSIENLETSEHKWYQDIKKDWMNIVFNKLAPIYKERYNTYVSLPAQPK